MAVLCSPSTSSSVHKSIGNALEYDVSVNNVQYSFSFPFAFLAPVLKSIVPLKFFLALSVNAPFTSISTLVFLPYNSVI